MVQENLRFNIWNKNSVDGEYIVINNVIAPVTPHSSNGRDLDYETIDLPQGFALENEEELLKRLEDGEDFHFKGKYIKVFSPRPLYQPRRR